MKNTTGIKITTQEFDFLRKYIDIDSDTFGNAYRSALTSGYSESYARVIKRHYSSFRMQLLKKALKNDGLVRMIETLRGVDLGEPIYNEEAMNRILRKREKDEYGMTAKEIISACKKLFGKNI